MNLPTPLATLPDTVWKWIGGFIGAFVAVTIANAALTATVLAMTDAGDDVTPDSAESSSFQLAIFALVHAWTGHLGFGASTDEFSGGAGVTFPLGVFAVLGLAALAWAARWLTRSFRPASRAAMWGQIAAAVVGSLIILLILGLIGRPSDDEFYISALGFGGVVRTVFLLALVATIGVALAVPRGRRIDALFGRQVSRVVQQVWSSIDAALVHVAAWSVIGLLLGLAAAVVIRDDIPFGVSVLYVLAAVPAAMSWGNLGGIGFSVSGSQDIVEFMPSEYLDNTTFTLFSEETHAALWLLPLLTVAVVAFIAVRLTLLRAPGSSIDVRHLAATPFALVVAWFVITRVVGRMGADLSIEDSTEEVSGDFAVGPVWWTFVLLFLIGIVIELVHAFVGVTLVQLLPRSLVQRLVPRPHPAWGPYLGGVPGPPSAAGQPPSQPTPPPPAQPGDQQATPAQPEDEPTVQAPAATSEREDTTVTGASAAAWGQSTWAAPAQTSWGEGSPQQWGQPQPVSRRSKIIAGSVVGALALVVLAWVVLGQIGKRYFGPEGVALDYASAVVEGRGSDAVEIGRVNVADRHRVLLSDEVYGASESRPDAAEVVDVEESDDGESATVTVEFEQDGRRFTQDLAAEKSGRRMLVFSGWELRPVELREASATVIGDSVTVNGETVDVSEIAGPNDPHVTPLGSDGDVVPGYELSLPALPGSYELEAPTTKFSASEAVTVDVPGDDSQEGEEDLETGEAPTVAATPNKAFADEVNAQIKKKVDGCVSNFDEETCPWNSQYADDSDYKGVTFSVDGYPTYTAPDGGDEETLREGEGLSLDLDDSVEVTEEATCTDETFFCDENDTTDTTTGMSTSGWSVTYEGDKLSVDWSDDVDWEDY